MKNLNKKLPVNTAGRVEQHIAFAQTGFTLIELMLSITLGLLLTAAAIQLFISGSGNYRIQQAASTIQDNGIFAMNAVTRNIRLANHGNGKLINDQTLYGGIVLSAQTTTGVAATPPASTVHPDGNLKGLKVGTTLISGDGYISKDAYNDSAFGTVKSDQLVIIYQAPLDTVTCTGRKVKGPNRTITSLTKGWYVVERYYIKKDTAGQRADLYCSSAMFIATGETVLPQEIGTGTDKTEIDEVNVLTADYGAAGSGQMIAKNVDYMRVQLIVRNKDKTTATMSIGSYTGLTVNAANPNRPAIIGVNLGWLVRSSEKVSNNTITKYHVLDQELIPPDDGYMRHVYNMTVALRNGGLGEIEQ